MSHSVLLKWEMFQTELAEKFVFISNTFFQKSYRLWDNVEKCDTVRQATDDNIKLCMCFACWITKTTDTHSEYISWCLSTATMDSRTRLNFAFRYIACVYIPGIRDGLLLQTGMVWPQIGIQLSRSRRIFTVLAVPRPRLEARHILLKRKKVPPASHYCSKQVFTPAFWRISYVFHEVSACGICTRQVFLQQLNKLSYNWVGTYRDLTSEENTGSRWEKSHVKRSFGNPESRGVDKIKV